MTAPGDLLALPAFGEHGAVHVVIETPRGSGAKLKYEPKFGAFMLSRLLGPGIVYPHDWGFVPQTVAEDGDPVDAFLIGAENGAAASTFPGLVVRARAIGVLEAEQEEHGARFRNDRLLFVPWTADDKADDKARVADVRDFRTEEKEALENFFRHAVEGTGKILTFRGWHGPQAAAVAIERGRARFREARRERGQSRTVAG